MITIRSEDSRACAACVQSDCQNWVRSRPKSVSSWKLLRSAGRIKQGRPPVLGIQAHKGSHRLEYPKNSRSSRRKIAGLSPNTLEGELAPVFPPKIKSNQFVLPCNFKTLTLDGGIASSSREKPYPLLISQSPAFLSSRSQATS